MLQNEHIIPTGVCARRLKTNSNNKSQIGLHRSPFLVCLLPSLSSPFFSFPRISSREAISNSSEAKILENPPFSGERPKKRMRGQFCLVHNTVMKVKCQAVRHILASLYITACQFKGSDLSKLRWILRQP